MKVHTMRHGGVKEPPSPQHLYVSDFCKSSLGMIKAMAPEFTEFLNGILIGVESDSTLFRGMRSSFTVKEYAEILRRRMKETYSLLPEGFVEFLDSCVDTAFNWERKARYADSKSCRAPLRAQILLDLGNMNGSLAYEGSGELYSPVGPECYVFNNYNGEKAFPRFEVFKDSLCRDLVPVLPMDAYRSARSDERKELLYEVVSRSNALWLLDNGVPDDLAVAFGVLTSRLNEEALPENTTELEEILRSLLWESFRRFGKESCMSMAVALRHLGSYVSGCCETGMQVPLGSAKFRSMTSESFLDYVFGDSSSLYSKRDEHVCVQDGVCRSVAACWFLIQLSRYERRLNRKEDKPSQAIQPPKPRLVVPMVLGDMFTDKRKVEYPLARAVNGRFSNLPKITVMFRTAQGWIPFFFAKDGTTLDSILVPASGRAVAAMQKVYGIDGLDPLRNFGSLGEKSLSNTSDEYFPLSFTDYVLHNMSALPGKEVVTCSYFEGARSVKSVYVGLCDLREYIGLDCESEDVNGVFTYHKFLCDF